ncbi:MAG: SEC-C domain-containing protein, partial [Thermoguttaceae bacterium]|nr:SEC-C domain-containing protein [Thermoguttaceae bacterium]
EQLDEKFINYVWTETEAHHETLSGNSVVDGIRQQQDAAVEMSKTHKVETIRNKTARIGRNEPCPCGSGKKYKNCCGKKA